MDCAGGNETHTDESRDYLMATKAKRVLILGGGFGGIYAALKLEKLLRRHDDLEVTLITRDNYFLFTPMLPEVAAGELEQKHDRQPLAQAPQESEELCWNDRSHRPQCSTCHRVPRARWAHPRVAL